MARKMHYQRKPRQETLEQVYSFVCSVGCKVSMTEIGQGINPSIARSPYLKGILDQLVNEGWICREWHEWSLCIGGWVYFVNNGENQNENEYQLSLGI